MPIACRFDRPQLQRSCSSKVNTGTSRSHTRRWFYTYFSHVPRALAHGRRFASHVHITHSHEHNNKHEHEEHKSSRKVSGSGSSKIDSIAFEIVSEKSTVRCGAGPERWCQSTCKRDRERTRERRAGCWVYISRYIGVPKRKRRRQDTCTRRSKRGCHYNDQQQQTRQRQAPTGTCSDLGRGER